MLPVHPTPPDPPLCLHPPLQIHQALNQKQARCNTGSPVPLWASVGAGASGPKADPILGGPRVSEHTVDIYSLESACWTRPVPCSVLPAPPTLQPCCSPTVPPSPCPHFPPSSHLFSTTLLVAEAQQPLLAGSAESHSPSPSPSGLLQAAKNSWPGQGSGFGATCTLDVIPLLGCAGGSVVKNLPANAGDVGHSGLIPELGGSSGGGHGNRLQCSCLENSMDRGAWQATVHGDAKSRQD